MSISRMVSMDVARMVDNNMQSDPSIKTLEAAIPPENSRSGPPMPPFVPGQPATAPAAGSEGKDGAASALDVLARYIPSEVVAIYIFGLSILDTVATQYDETIAWGVLAAICVALVCLFVVVNWVVLDRKTDKDLPFPRWALIAGLISFCIWGIAIPGNPITDGNNVLSMLVGFCALVSSHVLLLVENLFPKG